MELIKNYRENEALRCSFNALTEKTFGFHFEDWYQKGYWGEDYRPYSMVEDGRVVANVSVNHTNFNLNGRIVRLIQLGTVMTDEAYRNRGLIRTIMEEIERDYAGKVDGMYLFANDEVVEFYPKFGFCQGQEWQYSTTVGNFGPCRMRRVSMAEAENRIAFERGMARSAPIGAFDMAGNHGLIFFYVASFMADCVYYSPELDAWAIAEKDGEKLMLHAVYGADAESIIAAFGGEIRRVALGFAPADAAGYERELLREEDCTFFVKGVFFEEFDARCLRIPTLSHA